MFRWCSYCQRLMGESEPLDDYRLSHGICAACEPGLAAGHQPAPESLHASHLLSKLMATLARQEEGQLERFLEMAGDFGLRPSDILVGVIQPALQEVGRLWENDKITVADEHRFTQLCARLYSRLPAPRPLTGPVSILLALAPDNRHDIGVRILEWLATERGVRCRVLPTGTAAAAIVSAVAEERPSMLGISMALPSSAETVRDILERCAQAVPGLRLLVGGRAVRGQPPDFIPNVKGAKRVDDFLAEVAEIARGRA